MVIPRTLTPRAFENGFKLLALSLLIVLMGGLETVAASPDQAASDWLAHNGGNSEASYSELKDINRGNVARLGLAWSLDLENEMSLEATPLAVAGVLYFTGSMSVAYAVDAATGRLLWRYDPESWKRHPERAHFVFPVNRGMAYWHGRVYFATRDGRLMALDAATGRPVWSVDTLGDDMRMSVTGAPRVCDGKVVIGNSGGDWGVRGYVTAYEGVTGKQAWRFYTVPGDPAQDGDDPAMKMAAKTWSADHFKVSGGGGTAWDSMTCDQASGRLYIGVGNSGPYNPEVRSPGGGDNLFMASIVAVNARTGRYVWHYQENPNESWDWKATTNMIMAALPIEGRSRQVLMQVPSNGFLYVIDRSNGQLLSAEKIGKVTWADHIDLKTGRPVEAPNIRFETGDTIMWPSPAGAHNWQPMAYNPRTALVYIPYMQLGGHWSRPTRDGEVRYSLVLEDERDGKGDLVAWDPVSQKERWRIHHQTMWNGGVLTSAGDLVFQGRADGELTAYDAATGRSLWHFDAKLGIIAAPMTYRAGGKQYLSILVGYGASTAPMFDSGWKFGAQPRRLLTFALDGTAALPFTTPPDLAVHALDAPDLRIDVQKVSAGAGLYGGCGICHGIDLKSSGTAPDLRESAAALDVQSFRAVVRGALISKGMPRFDNLSDDDIDKLFMYIRAGARAAKNNEPFITTDGGLIH